ncbi:histidinol-phosphate aminotransferase [Silvibacterium bohemicum]|uniref:Histidinol-phosphate aminotransferase n=1 Tax=Silvibacterium bohemicum TaxID=1577686 RepID=A0A841K113_9BACT|nr:histidinol-phosphate transaminase [Silvibacterium bohemicum]MBB6145649.1 histidinol-phosphate aminotransferase [Silvibacterium bohemicum]
MPELTTNRLAPQPRELIQRMKEYHPPLGDRSGVRLDFNENTFACSPKVLEALGQVSRAQLTMYPEREHVEAIAAQHLELKPTQALLTNGVDEAIHVLCQTYLGAGDEMLLPVPTYSMYAVYASGTEAKLIEVRAEEDFRFPLNALLASITPATKIIAIANPNSPTGQAVRRDEILKIVAAAPHAMILIDEAYFHFYGETVMDLVGRVPNVIVARTFSKVYGLAGLRLGLLAADETAMKWLRRVISPYSVNSLALACLPAALEDRAYLDWYVGEVRAAREEFTAALARLGVKYWPSEANFVLTKIGAKHAAFSAAMRARGVLVRDRSSDPGCDGCVRITIGTREHTAAGMKAMEAALREIGWTGDEA